MNLFELYNVLKDGQKGRNNFLVTVVQGNGTGSRYFLADGEVKAQCGSGDIETERLREPQRRGVVAPGIEVSGALYFLVDGKLRLVLGTKRSAAEK